MADLVVQAQSTQFARSGVTTQQRGYLMPTALFDYITAAYTRSSPSSTISNASQNALYALIIQDSEIIPGGVTLYNIQSLDPLLRTGAADLEGIYSLDPFSTDYETNTAALYNRIFAVARGVAQTGPVNVRGGTARQGFELADLDTQQSINRFREIWQNQLATAQLVTQAVQVANANENAVRAMQLQAQQQQAATEQGRVMQTLGACEQITRDREVHIRALAAGGEFQSLPNMATTETLSGMGFQGAANTSFGMSTWR